jgi:hypothetical protein
MKVSPTVMSSWNGLRLRQIGLVALSHQLRCSSEPSKSIARWMRKKNVLVYSTKLINGSPFNSISVVPVEVR